MGLFDIFSDQPAKDAAAAQAAGLNAGYSQASGNINQGIDALKTNYSAALQPYMKNYATAGTGVAQLGNVLGLNGQGGSDAALSFLRNSPGYKFQQGTLDDTVNAAAAANGTLNSGNQLLALNKVNQGLADSTYSNYVSQLQPFLGASQSAAGGIAGINAGLGSSMAGQYGDLAKLGYQTQTGIGNANANADLAKTTSSGNALNAIGSIGSAIASFAPFLLSDKRVKEDIEPVGELYDGQPVYKYRYVGSPVFQIGLMAQDVEKTKPDAVIEIAGVKAVDYNKATEYAADLSRFLEAA